MARTYTAHDFKKFVRSVELTHVTTSPYYPQSNGKIERFHRTLKTDGIRHGDLMTLETAQARITKYIDYYNQQRLHAAIDYVTPADKLTGKAPIVFAERKEKLMLARNRRQCAVSKTATTVEGELLDEKLAA